MTKPLILLSLLIYFGYSGKHLARWPYHLTLAALAFSCLGDIFLLFDGISSLYFILGLVSFLLAHFLYAAVFLKNWHPKPQWGLHTITLVLIAYATLLFLQLLPNLAAMTYPVVVYVLGILCMAISALRRFQTVANKSFWLVFIGAVFFVMSDSLLAINMFKQPIPWSNVLIMSTYALAQYLIVKGVLLQSNR